MRTHAVATRAIRDVARPRPAAPTPGVRAILRSPRVQPKLRVGATDDPAEREADRVADQIMRMPDPAVQRPCCASCATGGTCADEVKRETTPGPILPHGRRVDASLVSDLGSGRPLPASERAFFEPRFGRDFNDVRLHSGTEATVAARSAHAQAYALGSNVVFAEARYRPGTEAGRKLLAHELAHTIQQAGAGAPEVQRKIGDGHDLTSSRFAGDLVLEAVYDGERQLKSGDKGEAVSKLQSALVDAGFSRSGLRANGNFGAETTAAVMDFQRASGLGGGMVRGLDGIVDATTMGWLDQRFSKGPTPPSKTTGGTPGCTAFKTVSVDLVSFDGSTGFMFQDLHRASSIFNQCCVRFTPAGGGSESPARTRELLGGDNVLHMNPRVGKPTAEEIGMFNGATADFNLSGRIRAFYVASITPSTTPEGDVGAYSVPPIQATGFRAAVRNMVVITNAGSERALAHEFGHILLNEGGSAHKDMDSEYLMSPAGPIPGERITPGQCGTIFTNA